MRHVSLQGTLKSAMDGLIRDLDWTTRKLTVMAGSNGSEAGIAIPTRYAINPVQLTLSQTLPPQATHTQRAMALHLSHIAKN